MIKRGDEIAVVVVTYASARVDGPDYVIVRRQVVHVTKKGYVLIERGGWFAPEEEGLLWAQAEHVDALRVAVAL